MVLISIVTVNFNDKQGLERTINSVQEQTATNYEHIIIDGNSNDGSKGLIELYKSYFSYWISEPDNGVYDAMNKGIEKANGDYLLFLNSGDHFKDDHSLSNLVAVIDESDPVDFIYGDIEVIGEKTWVKTYPSKLSIDFFIRGSLPHPATLISKRCFHKNQYDTNLEIVADWKFFMLSIINESFSYFHINETISVFYYDGLSSMNPKKVASERKRVVKNHFPNKLSLHYQYFPNNSKGIKKRITRKLKTTVRKLLEMWNNV